MKPQATASSPVVWFIPPLAAAIVFADLGAVFPALGEKAYEGAYVAMAIETMPGM